MTAGAECVIRAAASADAGAIKRLAIELARHVRDPDPKLSAEYLEAQLFSTDPCLVAEVRGLMVGFLTYCKQFEVIPVDAFYGLAIFMSRHNRGICASHAI